jgi:hypothetical protein
MKNVLVGIVTCEKYRQARLQGQLETWVPLLRQRGYNVKVFDGAFLGVSDAYEDLPYKVRALCRYAVKHGVEHILKIDDDSYICANCFETVTADYAGVRRLAHNNGVLDNDPTWRQITPRCTIDYAQGAAYWMSRRSFSIVAEAEPDGDWAEDRWIGRVLANHGVLLTELPDYLIAGETTGNIYDATVLTQIPPNVSMTKLHQRFLNPTGETRYRVLRPHFFLSWPAFPNDMVIHSWRQNEYQIMRDDRLIGKSRRCFNIEALVIAGKIEELTA